MVGRIPGWRKLLDASRGRLPTFSKEREGSPGCASSGKAPRLVQVARCLAGKIFHILPRAARGAGPQLVEVAGMPFGLRSQKEKCANFKGNNYFGHMLKAKNVNDSDSLLVNDSGTEADFSGDI